LLFLIFLFIPCSVSRGNDSVNRMKFCITCVLCTSTLHPPPTHSHAGRRTGRTSVAVSLRGRATQRLCEVRATPGVQHDSPQLDGSASGSAAEPSERAGCRCSGDPGADRNGLKAPHPWHPSNTPWVAAPPGTKPAPTRRTQTCRSPCSRHRTGSRRRCRSSRSRWRW